MVITNNNRKSFKKAWRLMNDVQKEEFKNAYLNRGFAISTFYNDKAGLSNIPKERIAIIESIADKVGVKNIWD